LSVITSNAGSNQPGSSTINLLSGGTLTTGNITKNANGTSYLNFNGGTLKVGTTSTALGSSLSGVYSYSGGATVDTNGLNYTIAASIQAPTASGISNIAITDGGADYIGAPAVVISGGSGTGATAIAEISNGRVSNIVITNPGTGYSPSDTLTVTLSGGGFSNNNSATMGSVSFASNTSGGLAKNGAGTLTLTGNNNYTGATIVNNGALQVGNAGVGKTGTGAVSVESGATIFGTGTVQGSSFTAKSGSTVQAGDSTASSSFGTLTFSPVSGTGSFDFQSGSTTILGLNLSGASDLLNFVGNGANTLNFNGNLTVGPAFFTPTGTAVFNLLDWSGLSGAPTFASRFSAGSYGSFLLGNGDDNLGFDLPDISTSGFGWDISNFVTAGSISLVVVPEPSRALLLMLGLIGLAGRRRRQ
jgi:autotransporter-associated beta strand protein